MKPKNTVKIIPTQSYLSFAIVERLGRKTLVPGVSIANAIMNAQRFIKRQVELEFSKSIPNP